MNTKAINLAMTMLAVLAASAGVEAREVALSATVTMADQYGVRMDSVELGRLRVAGLVRSGPGGVSVQAGPAYTDRSSAFGVYALAGFSTLGARSGMLAVQPGVTARVWQIFLHLGYEFRAGEVGATAFGVGWRLP